MTTRATTTAARVRLHCLSRERCLLRGFLFPDLRYERFKAVSVDRGYQYPSGTSAHHT